MEWAALYPKYILFSLTLNSTLAQGWSRGNGGVNRVWLRTLSYFPLPTELSALRRKKGSCPVLTWKKKVFWAKAIEWPTVLNIWNKRREKVLCIFISWWKILPKFLQWPCNEPLNALRATSARKRNYLQLFERSNWVNLHGAARLRNNFCRAKNYITFKNNSCTC